MGKAIIFDVDGTLIHTSMNLVNAVVKKVIDELGYGEFSFEKVSRFWWGDRNISRRELIELEFKISFDDFIPLFRNHTMNFDYVKQFKRLYDDVKPVLDELLFRGIPLGVVTDAPLYIAAPQLNYFLGNGYFSEVIMTHELENVGDKPAPDGLLLCMEKLGTRGAIFVGDSDSDTAAAQSAGIPAILIERGEHETYVKPDRTIKTLYELL